MSELFCWLESYVFCFSLIREACHQCVSLSSGRACVSPRLGAATKSQHGAPLQQHLQRAEQLQSRTGKLTDLVHCLCAT